MTTRADYETVRDAVDELVHQPRMESIPGDARDPVAYRRNHEINRLLVIEFAAEVCAAHGWTVDELDAEANRRIAAGLNDERRP